MKTKMTLILFFFAAFFVAQAQDNQETGLTYVGESSQKFTMPSLASRSNLEQPVFSSKPPQDGRSAKVNVIPEKDPQRTNDYFSENPHPLAGQIPTRDALFDFVVGNNVGSPSDPAIAIGPDHAFVVYNTGFMIYDKDGNIVQGPTNPSAIFNSGGCCDLTASYDNLAERWVITYLGNGVLVAVSSDSNPVTSTWDVYSLPQVNDYNKLSVWRDGYYITDNGARDVWALDRDAVLAGDPTAGIQGFTIAGVQGQGFTSAQVLNITNDVHPATGGAPLIFMRDDGFGGVSEDAVNIWTVNVDFDTPGNSTVSDPEVFTNIEPFINVFDGGSFANLEQPGGGSDIDALQSTIMNQAQFRKFPTYNSAIFNFVVDVEASNSVERAGIRWYEFRQTTDGGPWSIEQEGTYTAPDGRHAWMGSMAMDNQGNIGMGYTTMAGPTTPNPTGNRVSAAYTGRFSTDAPGVMTIAETIFGASTNNINGNRFGDYAKLDVDPNNDDEFWFITEYRFTNHVAVFKIAPDAAVDTGIIAISQPEDGDLGMTESVTVTVRNFGTDIQTNVPVSFTIDGGPAINEVVAGPIPPASNIEYTFTATANLSVEGTTYTVCAATNITGDEIPDNDQFCKDVTSLNDDDTGAIAITAPVSGQLGNTEQITITIENFGVANQTSIPVFYNINGGPDVTATYTGDLAQGETDTFTFTDTEDFSVAGDYIVIAGTNLAGDGDATNDTVTVTIESASVCQPTSGCEDFNDGVTVLELADQNVNPECGTDPAGYSDDTDTVFNFVLNDNPFNGVVQTGFGNSNFNIWIDFNDNDVFEANEMIADGTTGAADSDTSFVVDFSSISTTTTGMHTMRVRGGDENNGTGDVSDPCSDLQYGRTNDFTANVTGVLGVDDATFSEAAFIITSTDNKMFDLQFNTTTYTDNLNVHVYNTLGQNLAFYTLENNGSGYTKTINMSYVAAGVYFVRIGDKDLNKVQRIIVR
ncbi:MAG: hypothetical protein ACI849_000103 [Patiriisocius sp.]|jgi:hypothetical protein